MEFSIFRMKICQLCSSNLTLRTCYFWQFQSGGSCVALIKYCIVASSWMLSRFNVSGFLLISLWSHRVGKRELLLCPLFVPITYIHIVVVPVCLLFFSYYWFIGSIPIRNAVLGRCCKSKEKNVNFSQLVSVLLVAYSNVFCNCFVFSLFW